MRNAQVWVLSLSLLAVSCAHVTDPEPDKNTNWLRECSDDGACGSGLSCLCGRCTTSCGAASECGPNGFGFACEPVDGQALRAQCAGSDSDSAEAICVARCARDADCGDHDGLVCRTGLCVGQSSLPDDSGTDAADITDAEMASDAGMDGAVPEVDAGWPDSGVVNTQICGDETDGGMIGEEAPTCELVVYAFVGECPDACKLFVMGASGEATVLIDNRPGSFEMGWSPDGKRLAFTVANKFQPEHEIYLTDADGQNQRNLTNNPFDEHFVGWLSRGREIAFKTNRNGDDDIWVMNADGSNQRRLVSLPVKGFTAFSPDGARAAVISGGVLWVMNADGTAARSIAAANAAKPRAPVWSPDSRKLAFASRAFGNMEIHVIDADGTHELRVTHDPASDELPSWSPDGKRLAFSRDADVLYTIAIDGTDEQRLQKNAFNAVWRWPR